jgi:hypothetical protein
MMSALTVFSRLMGMAFALSKKKKVINIFLEETQLTPGMELQLGNTFIILNN